MKMKKALLICIFVVLNCFYYSCSKFDLSTSLNNTPIQVELAKEIKISEKLVDNANGFKSYITIPSVNHPNAYISICVRNSEKVFYTVEYMHYGAQYPYLIEIYSYDTQKKISELLYTAQHTYNLNELFSTEKYLFWIEYINNNNETIYNLNQYELSSGKVTTIASRNANEVHEITLSVSEDYVTWYDSYIDGNVNIAIYNIKSQTLQIISDCPCVKFAPYERLEIVNNCITFFTTDSKENNNPKEAKYNVYINQYNLLTGETKILLLGERKNFPTLAGCFSNERYIGWFTDYYKGDYYLWDIDKKELFHLDLQDIHVFTFQLQEDLYLYDSEKDVIYQYIFDEDKTMVYNIDEGACILFRIYGDNVIYMDCYLNDEAKIITLEQ